MNLIKTSLLSLLSTVIRVVSGFLVTKIIAVYAGPSGLVIIGQLQNLINISLVFSGNFLRTSTTKFTAQYHNSHKYKFILWSASIRIAIVLNITTIVFLLFFSERISEYIFNGKEYEFIIKLLAINLPFFVLNTIFLSILNGSKEIYKYIFLTILQNLISVFIVIILAVNYGSKGVLIAYVVGQSVASFATMYFVKNLVWFKKQNFFQKVNGKDITKILGFAVITITAILSSNISLFYIRDYIVLNVSTEGAGYWQGILTLSQASLGLITMSLTTYFLPTIASIKEKSRITRELKKVMKIALPFAVIISILIYILRDLIILLLYTEEFHPMRGLFLWQMIGNIFRVAGWLIGYIFVAKAMVKYSVTIEITLAVITIVISRNFIKYNGLVGATQAYAIVSILYCLVMYYLYKYKFKLNE
jgi:polysaccharide transporter, PST family